MSKGKGVSYLGFSDYIKECSAEREKLFLNWLDIVGYDTFAAEVWSLYCFKFLLMENTSQTGSRLVGGVMIELSDSAFIDITVYREDERTAVSYVYCIGDTTVHSKPAEVDDVHKYIHSLLKGYIEQYHNSKR